jgi:hypothetical protein
MVVARIYIKEGVGIHHITIPKRSLSLANTINWKSAMRRNADERQFVEASALFNGR